MLRWEDRFDILGEEVYRTEQERMLWIWSV